MEFHIRFAQITDIQSIQEIARLTWPNTYSSIISMEQIDFMLDWMYSTSKIEEAISAKDQDFLIIESKDKILGYAGIEHHYQNKNVTRIHKLYVLPETQGTGAGKALLAEIIHQAKANRSTLLHLNVNKANKAVDFYKHVGFIVADTEILDIGNGYVMDDYIMTLNLVS